LAARRQHRSLLCGFCLLDGARLVLDKAIDLVKVAGIAFERSVGGVDLGLDRVDRLVKTRARCLELEQFPLCYG
jgi:hypothetical protein